MKKIFVAVLFIVAARLSQAQTPISDRSKRNYNIFHPTPKPQMRGMQTDRPDVTESAYSLDAGHFQVEADAYRLRLNDVNGVHTRESFYNFANMKIGISNSIDLQLVVPFFTREEVTAANGTVSHNSSGFNDFTIRVKKNLWGNDQGRTALAIMPFVHVQTGQDFADKRAEGGVIIPFSAALNETWSFGAQGQFSLLKNEKRKYDSELLNSVTLGAGLSSQSSAFIEGHYTYNFNQRNFACYVNGGFVIAFTENLRIDLGVNYGLTTGSDRMYFLGYSFRY